MPEVEALLETPPYGIDRAAKEALLERRLAALTAHHRQACPAYARILDALWPPAAGALGGRLADMPWLPVGLFKTHELRSIPEDAVFKVLTSSGTTAQAVSRIPLDRESAALQTRTLAATMAGLLGRTRRPMLIVDARETVRDRRSFSARGAGLIGMATFGRDHCYALDADMGLKREEVRAWLDRHAGEPLLVFGFTFMVWQHLAAVVEPGELDLSHAILVHSGGWKKLQEQAVGAQAFRDRLEAVLGVRRVANFYGMVEQIGTVFLECSNGRLHAPNAADVIVRDTQTWRPAPDGSEGVVQVLSALPTSYPGHSLLTEDLGTVLARDDCGCGWLGTALEINGRIPRVELRGCSDTHAAGLDVAA
jgi:hypothetical protein